MFIATLYFISAFLVLIGLSAPIGSRELASQEKITLKISNGMGSNFIVDIKLDPISVTSYCEDPSADNTAGTATSDGGTSEGSNNVDQQDTNGSASQTESPNSGSPSKTDDSLTDSSSNGGNAANNNQHSKVGNSATSGVSQGRSSRTTRKQTSNISNQQDSSSPSSGGGLDTSNADKTDASSSGDSWDSESTPDKSSSSTSVSDNNLKGSDENTNSKTRIGSKDTGSVSNSPPNPTKNVDDSLDNDSKSGISSNEETSTTSDKNSPSGGDGVTSSVSTDKNSPPGNKGAKLNDDSRNLATGSSTDSTKSSDAVGTVAAGTSATSGGQHVGNDNAISSSGQRSGRFGKKQL